MNKKFYVLLLSIMLTSCGTSNKYKELEVPSKINPAGISALDSSVTTTNIEDYLFREDSQYIDLRPYSWVIKDGHIAGFEFFPFYDFLAHNAKKDRLFTFSNKNEAGETLVLGDVGTFSPNYVESVSLLNRYFSVDKNIFVISQSGLEGCYFINLLVQYGYDCSKLYNVGGYSISPGLGHIPYISIENPKYKVEGNKLIDSQINEEFNPFSELTPINK